MLMGAVFLRVDWVERRMKRETGNIRNLEAWMEHADWNSFLNSVECAMARGGYSTSRGYPWTCVGDSSAVIIPAVPVPPD